LCAVGAAPYSERPGGPLAEQHDTERAVAAADVERLTPAELELVLESTQVGTWRLDAASMALQWSRTLGPLHGLRAGEAPASFEEHLQLVHPADREPLDAAVQAALHDGVPYDIDVRVLWPDGSVHWLTMQGRVLRDVDGTPLTLVGVARDADRTHAVIDELVEVQRSGDEARALIDAVFASAPVCLGFVDTDLRYVRVNEALAALHGVPVLEHAGKRPSDVLGPGGLQAEALLRQALESGRTLTDVDIEAEVLARPGERRSFTASYFPVPNAAGRVVGAGVVVADVTERAAADRVREQMLERARFLAEASAALDASLDLDRTLTAVAELAVRRIADWCSIDLGDPGGPLRNVAVTHVDPEKVAFARELQQRYPPDQDAPTGAPNVVRTGEPELYPHVPVELLEQGARDAEHLEIIRSLDLASAMVLPLRARARTFGAITLIRTSEREPYNEDDLAFGNEIARRAALAVDNARLYSEAREQERRSEEARAFLDAIIEGAPIGFAYYDRDLRYVRVNDALAEMRGIPAAEQIGRTIEEVLPLHAPVIAERVRAALETGEPQLEVELSGPGWAGGPARHLIANYYRVALPGGEGLGVGAAIVDITERVEVTRELREQRDLYDTLLHAQSDLGEAFVLLDGERIVYVNEAAERIAGRSAEQLRALPRYLDLIPEEHHAAARRRLGRAASSEEVEPGFETELVRPDGQLVPLEVAAKPLAGERGRMILIARDITERKQQEQERQTLLAVEQAARRATQAAHEQQRMLADASALLERSRSLADTLQEVAELTVARLADVCTIDVRGLDGVVRRLGAESRAENGRQMLLLLSAQSGLARSPEHPVAALMRAGQPRFVDEPADRARELVGEAAGSPERLRETLGHTAAMLPLMARGRAVGAMSLGWREPGHRPTREEWTLIEALSQRVALAVDGALQFEERAHVARTLQASLLPPSLPRIPGAEAASHYAAAGEGIEVGGDFYDLFEVGDGRWALVMGDVCGKGAEAAAVTALARYTLRAVADAASAPDALLETLNATLRRQYRDPRFLTAVVGMLELKPDRGEALLSVACAGHPPPIVLRAKGGGEALSSRGRLVGVTETVQAVAVETTLRAGDTVVLYTDGITEARRPAPMTPEELLAVLLPHAGRGAGPIVETLAQLADRATGGHLRDDVAILAVRILPPPFQPRGDG
jgi:PAS domain S-box-containing protein